MECEVCGSCYVSGGLEDYFLSVKAVLKRKRIGAMGKVTIREFLGGNSGTSQWLVKFIG